MRWLLGLLFLVTACASASQNYNKQLQKWVGTTQQDLLNNWGEPDNVFYLTPRKFVITYVKVEQKPIDGNTKPYAGTEIYYAPIEVPSYGYPSNGSYNTYYCKTSFTITDNIVTDYTFNGDDCIAGE